MSSIGWILNIKIGATAGPEEEHHRDMENLRNAMSGIPCRSYPYHSADLGVHGLVELLDMAIAGSFGPSIWST